MKKEKNKVSLFEKVNITDPEYAEKLYQKEKKKQKIKLICTGLAAIGSIAGLLYISGSIESETLIVAIFGVWAVGFIAALVAGSFINFFKVVFKFASIIYYIIPFILFDILGFVFGLAIGLIGVVLFPVIPCIITLWQSRQNMKYAKDYLALYYQQSNNSDSNAQ